MADCVQTRHRPTDRDKALRDLGSAAATLAHEIRNPLHGIRGFASLLRQRMDESDPNRRLVEQIIACADGLNDILKGLCAFASDEKSPRADVAAAIEAALASAEAALAAKRIRVQTRLGDERMSVRAEHGQLQGVLLNLILNAAEASDTGGRIVIEAATDDDAWVTIRVRDKGCGIPPSMIERIFDEGVSTKPGSRGLGLAFVRRVVDSLGGTIAAHSRVGEGTEMHIRLPRRQAQETT